MISTIINRDESFVQVNYEQEDFPSLIDCMMRAPYLTHVDTMTRRMIFHYYDDETGIMEYIAKYNLL